MSPHDYVNYVHTTTFSLDGDIHTRYGAEQDQANRWRRVVNELDKSYPRWRDGYAFLGDAAVGAIAKLAAPVRKKADAQKRVDEAKVALAKAEAELKALS